MRNTGLDEVQLESRLWERNNNSFRYEDDTTLMEESEEELKRLLMKAKEIEKAGLKQHSKNKIMTFGPIISWQIDVETMEM